ncbi:MAG: sodium:solute symporter [Kiritimatiellae bacterium]|nr:sodium:solute symporter [Kiritimatiellia bacterium]
MNMSLLDWGILSISALALFIFSIRSARHMQGVSDFLSANRTAGRYLLTVAGGIAGIGAVSCVATFEMVYQAGFCPNWWGLMSIPMGLFITLTGYVTYRFRATRAMTLAQFYEMRYSKPFRVYAGLIAWVSGVVNFAIFPIVEARFFVWFCGLPVHYANVFGLQIDLTSAVVMFLTIGVSLLFANAGGQITVMVTDCAQGIYCLFAYLLIAGFLMFYFGWDDIVAGLKMAPAHASMLNPFDTANVPDFNVWYFLIGVVGALYGVMSWQGCAGYQSAGSSPHEQKMGGIIGGWRGMVQGLMLVLIPVAAYGLLHLPKYADTAAAVNNTLQTIPSTYLQGQMRVPVSLAHILPAGLKGLFATIMLFFLITTQDTYMHSWGSMLVQDVILPFRKQGFEPRVQIRLLRYSIAFVALFAFIFGLVFRQTEYILMFFIITGAIVGGAGACIVGGLYWGRGTPAGAWTAMTVGWVFAIGRIVVQQIGPLYKDVAPRGFWLQAMDKLNSYNSMYVSFGIMLSCAFSYVVVSLLTRNASDFSLDRVLHRGKYEVQGEHKHVQQKRISLVRRLMGITDEFTLWDRILAYFLLTWNLGWFVTFILGTVYNLSVGMSEGTWSRFWHIWVWMQFGIGVPATIWFAFGAIRDLRRLFHTLDTTVRDQRDDGRVVHHHLACEADENGSKPS